MNYKSLYFDQMELLDALSYLHTDGKFDLDATFGNGSFYRNEDEWPTYRFDIDESLENCEYANSSSIPLPDECVSSIIFDPPFLTYIKNGRTGNGKMIMARRFGGYWRYDELADHYKSSLTEFNRLLRRKGVVVVKCQDIIHNHRLHPTHIYLTEWANEAGFRLKDLFILGAKHRLPRQGKFTQRHARVYHSYFMVFEKIRSFPT